jgi:surface antigen
MVLRVNQSGNLANSMPCANCTNYMKTVAVKKGYKIKSIYYSNAGGSIDFAYL